MDIELSSLAALLLANGLILASIGIFLGFFYKWGSTDGGRGNGKTYDDLAENVVADYGLSGVGNAGGLYGGNLNNELLLGGDATSQIESLLAKDETAS